MRNRFFFWTLFVCAAPAITYGDCSASTNCGLCNSGSFTAQCICKDGAGFTCTTCNAANPCSSGTGCCCGVSTQNGKTQCSSYSCAGSGTCLTQLRGILLASNATKPLSELFSYAGHQSKTADDSTKPMILSMEPTVEIADFTGSGLVVSNVKLNIDSQQISGASYTIANNSGKTLLSYVSTLDYYWDIAPTVPLRENHSEDGWFLTGSLLGPGQQEEVELMSALRPHQPVHLLRVVVNVVFAEFSDGTAWGKIDRSTAQKLVDVRQEKLSVELEYASLLKAGLSAGQISAKLEADLSNPKVSSSTRTALLQLQIGLKNMGSDGLAQRILSAPGSVPATEGAILRQ